MHNVRHGIRNFEQNFPTELCSAVFDRIHIRRIQLYERKHHRFQHTLVWATNETSRRIFDTDNDRRHHVQIIPKPMMSMKKPIIIYRIELRLEKLLRD